MTFELAPLLQMQRDLYRLPRGMARFKQYLRTLVNQDGTDLELPPLVAMNPMGKDHLPALLDAYLALDAERIAAAALREAEHTLIDEPGHYRAGLVIADDLMGGWTNRFASEFSLRFPARTGTPRYWIAGVLWSSEPATAERVREAMLTAALRTAYLQRHSSPRTLAEMLAQEGHVLARAGCTTPALAPDEIDYTRAVLAEYLDATDMRTAIECLFGDEAGATLGFTPHGLSAWAGIALALHDARTSCSPATT